MTEAQGNATASLVRDWLAGRFDHPGELASRATQLGHTPAPPYGVVVLETERPLPRTPQRLAQILRPQARRRGPGGGGRGVGGAGGQSETPEGPCP